MAVCVCQNPYMNMKCGTIGFNPKPYQLNFINHMAGISPMIVGYYPLTIHPRINHWLINLHPTNSCSSAVLLTQPSTCPPPPSQERLCEAFALPPRCCRVHYHRDVATGVQQLTCHLGPNMPSGEPTIQLCQTLCFHKVSQSDIPVIIFGIPEEPTVPLGSQTQGRKMMSP